MKWLFNWIDEWLALYLEARFPPPLVTLLSAAAMWSLNKWMPVACWIPVSGNYLGLFFFVLGIATLTTAFRQFREAQTTINPVKPHLASRLVTDGIFRFSRNPMYVAFLMLLSGWAAWLGSATPWIICALFVTYISRFQIRPEERALAWKFGSQYSEYARRVPRWALFLSPLNI